MRRVSNIYVEIYPLVIWISYHELYESKKWTAILITKTYSSLPMEIYQRLEMLCLNNYMNPLLTQSTHTLADFFKIVLILYIKRRYL